MTTSDLRTSLVLAAVHHGIAAEQTDFTPAECRLAAQLHRRVGELLSAEQYEDMVREEEQ